MSEDKISLAFSLTKFANCEHKTLKCEKCGARSNMNGWAEFTGYIIEKEQEIRELNKKIDELEAKIQLL